MVGKFALLFDSREELDEWYDMEQGYLVARYMRRDIPWEEYNTKSKVLLQTYEDVIEENEWDR